LRSALIAVHHCRRSNKLLQATAGIIRSEYVSFGLNDWCNAA